MGELDRIQRLSRAFGGGPREGGALGVGDDAAVLPGALPVLATTDAVVEGVHFRRAFLSLEALAERAIEAAVSDIAAMGGAVDLPGCGLLLSWALPRELSEGDFERLVAGSAEASRRLGVPIVGGNLSSSGELSLTTTVLGRAEGAPVTRSGAVAGDVLAVTGTPGLRALGLAVLLQGVPEEGLAADAAEAWRQPRARLALGRSVRGRVHAMIDLSDGLLQDASQLGLASGVALVLDAARLPSLGPFAVLARSLGLDPRALGLAGGEDYELLAAGPLEAFDHAWTVIGRVDRGSGVTVLHGPGSPLQGWDHFR
ncbi:MAG: thiamine-phosphate kinase [Deltaproteobacteria bacterium]|nr:thiamine-phosphate kinase [Deltaproteobacteria bacterium]